MAEAITFDKLNKDISAGTFLPVYLLMGDEDYFIRQIAERIGEAAIAEEERDFCLSIFYGADHDRDITPIVNAARSVPMIGDRQVVVFREAQLALEGRWKERNQEILCEYLKKPAPNSILVLCYMHGKLDSRRRSFALIKEHGVVYEAKSLGRNEDIARFAINYVKERGGMLDDRNAFILAEHVGNDLSRLAGELQKLLLVSANKQITAEDIEKNIGISREFNAFELLNALVTKDGKRAARIVNYLANHSKQYPIQMILAVLFNYFSDLMLSYYSKDRSERGIKEFLGLRNDWAAMQYTQGCRNYTGMKTMHILRSIQIADAKSKGVDATGAYSDAENLRELIHFILH